MANKRYMTWALTRTLPYFISKMCLKVCQ